VKLPTASRGGFCLEFAKKEYYSRRVKKKVSTLANPEFHRQPQKLMKYRIPVLIAFRSHSIAKNIIGFNPILA
jgi:hypothetical protein